MSIIVSTSFQVPEQMITNEELVNSFNQFVAIQGKRNEGVKPSDPDFIYKAAGIRKRFVHDKEGILDVNRMRPRIRKRARNELSLQAEFALKASIDALDRAQVCPNDIDAIIVSCSNFQRAYPGIAVELQSALNIENCFSIDMNAGCASAVFGIAIAHNLISAHSAKKVLVVTPELYTFHLNFRDRRSHFIFGDGCSAVVLENEEGINGCFQIESVMLDSQFSNNIRNDFGFINAAEDVASKYEDLLFHQDGKKVSAEVVDIVTKHIDTHLKHKSLCIDNIKRLWLHQANININKNIANNLYKKNYRDSNAPITLDKYANTAASGVIGCFTENSDDFESGDQGIICAFGAGYHVGSVIIKKI